jgi:hypothetical protein
MKCGTRLRLCRETGAAIESGLSEGWWEGGVDKSTVLLLNHEQHIRWSWVWKFVQNRKYPLE